MNMYFLGTLSRILCSKEARKSHIDSEISEQCQIKSCYLNDTLSAKIAIISLQALG